MTMTIMYLAVAFLLAALAVSAYVRVKGAEFEYGRNPVASAAILLVVALTIDLLAQLTLGSQGWLSAEAQWPVRAADGTAKTIRPVFYLWKAGLAAQGLSAVFLILGIWRLFAAVGQIVPAGTARRVVRSAPAPVTAAPAGDSDTTD